MAKKEVQQEKKDDKKESKPINFKGKYIALAVMAAVLIVAIVLVVVFTTNKSEAKAVMQLETNPGVQLVLDNNDKVIAQVALNADGEEMLANASFMGLKAEVAAELFAKSANEMDKINTKTDINVPDGKLEVKITISAENVADYQDVAKKAKESVNKYFGENGVVARAVTTINTEIKDALVDLGVSAKEYAKKTNAEILEFAKNKSNEFKEVSIETRTKIESKFDELYGLVVSVADKTLDSAEKAYNAAKKKLDEVAKDALPIVKEGLQTAFNEAEKALNEAKKEFNAKKAEFEKQLNKAVAELKAAGQEAYNTLKKDAETAYNATKQLANNRINAYKKMSAEDKKVIQDAIIELRNKNK